jgi:2-furoyl-CoA dehydrogenase large subunit
VYFALDRLMQGIAATPDLDPLEVIRRNLVETFPYRCPAGAILDSGDYRAAVDVAGAGRARRIARPARSGASRRPTFRHRLCCGGRAVDLQYGYITTVLSPQERQKTGPKAGALAAATMALDPLGGVSLSTDSVPQGQGHRAVTAQIVADAFGLTPPRSRSMRGSIPARMPGRSPPATIRAGLLRDRRLRLSRRQPGTA